ncbi:MAG: hypothetical protein ACOVNY_10955 [Chitinophagaceae bacterium]
MQQVYKFLCFTALFLSLGCFVNAQETDTTITNIDADLVNLFTQKVPKKYKIGAINVTGNRYFI